MIDPRRQPNSDDKAPTKIKIIDFRGKQVGIQIDRIRSMPIDSGKIDTRTHYQFNYSVIDNINRKETEILY